ncbi:MAG: hypothetical protein KIH63_002295 [Candidatus Saccharibacteria bacterium]|nr:hypothetical protein [Candidatus Saccharibacteria bacterium]
MKRVSVNGLVGALWAVTLTLLVAGSATVGLGVANNYQVRVSPEHVDGWTGSGDLVVLTKSNIAIGEAVVVQGLQPAQAEGIARVIGVDQMAHRIEVIDSQGAGRQIAQDRVVGRVSASLSGVGNWLSWLSRPSHLVGGLLLPLLALVGLEIQSVARLWHTAKRYKTA